MGLDLVLVDPPVPQEERVVLCLDNKAAWLPPLAPSSSPYSLLCSVETWLRVFPSVHSGS